MAADNKASLKEINVAVLSGFDMAAQKGPLMDEPMQGSVFIVEEISSLVSQSEEVEEAKGVAQSMLGTFSGQIIPLVRNLCKRAFLNAEPRIGEAMYLCKLTATQFTYGICYNIIEKSRGKVI